MEQTANLSETRCSKSKLNYPIMGELVDPKGEKYGAMKHFAIFIPSIPLRRGGRQRTSQWKQREDWLYLLQRGPSGSCSGRSSSAPPPWRRCRPGWPGSWCRCRPPSSGRSSGTCWASPRPSASPAQLQAAQKGFEKLGNVGKSDRKSLTDHLKKHLVML